MIVKRTQLQANVRGAEDRFKSGERRYMGSYIYTRQTEVIEATESLTGMKMFLNVYKYAFKPYWDIWTYGASPYSDEWEKKVEKLYNRTRKTAANRFLSLELSKKLSHFVLIGDWRKNAIIEVYQEEEPAPMMIDDAWFGVKGKRIGILQKVGRKWVCVMDRKPTNAT